jgi:hypothetical protein
MSTLLLPSDLLKVSVWCTNAEQASVNTFWYSVIGVGSPDATDQDMATELDTGFLNTALPPILNNLTRYNGVEVQIYRPTGTMFVIFNAAISIAGAGMGTGGALALPRQTSGITDWRTRFAGRAYRGRTYWPFPSVSHDVGDGIPTGAYITLISTLATGFLNFTNVTGSGTATVQLVMRHRKNKAGTIPIPSQILVGTQLTKWATQRRRGSFGRPNVSPI